MKSFQFTVSKGGTSFAGKNTVSKELFEKIMKAKMKMKIKENV